MSDKLNENITPDEKNETLQPPKPKYEENDNWQFDGVAHTLDDTVIENGEIEIVIPKKESEYETRERPVAEKASATAAPAEPREDSANSVKFFAMAVFIVMMAGVLAFFGIRYYNTPNTTEKMNPGNVALTIGDTDVSIGMYNYYYNSTVNYYVQQAGYGYVELDTTKSYASQKTTGEDGEEVTWEQRFKDDTESQLQRLVAYYEAAQKEGTTLTDEQKKLIEDDIEQIKSSASEQEVSVDTYISTNFGEYCGIATLQKMEEMSYIAQTYLRKATINIVPDEERVQKYYEEHQADYQQVEMCYLVMQYDDNTKNDVIKEAKKYASQIKNEKELKKLIPVVCKDLIDAYVENGTYGDADAVAEQIAKSANMTVTKSNPNQLPQAIIDFLFNEENKKGACRTVADDTYQAVFIVLKNSGITVSDDEVYSVRHILIMPETEKADDDDTTETAEPTKEQWEAAKEKANKVLDEYNSGERTEYSFALLAEKYSDDTASLSSGGSNFGGVYSNTPLGQMVSEFEDWATDKNRTYGDVEIVKSDFGYHIMYFISDGPSYLAECKVAVQLEMEDEFVAEAKIKEHKNAMKKTTVAKPTTSTQSDTQQSITDDSIVDDSIVDDSVVDGSEEQEAVSEDAGE